MELTEVLIEIGRGSFDDSFGVLQETMRQRKKEIGRQNANEMKVGDRVRFTDDVRPKYLIGAEAVVTGKKQTRVVVELVEPHGKYAGDVRVPPVLLEIV